MPQVSVVVPSYNSARYIAETLESILAQTYEDFELVVADHTSTDGTLDIVARYVHDPRVRLLVTDPGGGAQRNWNRVSRAATGEYLKLVCADDVLHPESLSHQLTALRANEQAVLVASPRRIVDVHGKEVLARRGLAGMQGVHHGSAVIRRLVRAGANILGEPVCVLMRREALAASGWWDSRFPYLIDQATYVRMLRHGSLVALPEVLADFRLSDTQWSVALAESQFEQTSGFHRWVHEEMPDVVSRNDVRIGNVRAGVAVAGRRAIYWALAHRLRGPQAA